MKARATHLVLPAYILAALVFTWPLARDGGHALPVTGRLQDARMQAYLLGWDWHALATRPLGVFDAPIFHPERNTLTYMDHMLGEAAIGAPVRAATGAVAPAYAFLVWFAFAASAWAAYRLARACGASRLAAWLAGFLFSFSPYHFSNLDQLNVLHIEALPLALWFALRALTRGRWRDWLGLAASALLELSLGWYYTFYLGLALAVLAAWALACARDDVRRVAWPRAAVALAAFAVLALPLTLPYMAQQRAMPEFHRTLAEMDAHAAGLGAYFRVDPGALAARWMPVDGGDKGYWPGFVTIGLLVAGLAALRRARAGGTARGTARYAAAFAWLAGAAFVFSLGPYLHGAQHRNLGVPLPYLVLYRLVPGFASMRAPGRLAVLVLLGLAVLAALGFDRVRAGVAARRGAGAARAFAAAIVAVALIEPLHRPWAMADLPTAATLPPVYAWLRAQPGATPVLDVPLPADSTNEGERDILRQYIALLHGKPRLDGASGFVSHRYRAFRVAMRDFPTAAALDTARSLGAGIVIVHWGDYAPADRAARQAALERLGRLEPVATFGIDAAYRWAAAPATR